MRNHIFGCLVLVGLVSCKTANGNKTSGLESAGQRIQYKWVGVVESGGVKRDLFLSGSTEDGMNVCYSGLNDEGRYINASSVAYFLPVRSEGVDSLRSDLSDEVKKNLRDIMKTQQPIERKGVKYSGLFVWPQTFGGASEKIFDLLTPDGSNDFVFATRDSLVARQMCVCELNKCRGK